MGEPGGLPSMGSHRVRHDWSDLAAATAAHPNCQSAWTLRCRQWGTLLGSLALEHSSYHSVLCYAKSLQSCPTLCDPMDCSPPDSSVQGILQVRILEWVAISSSRGSSRPRDWTGISCVGRWILLPLSHLLGRRKIIWFLQVTHRMNKYTRKWVHWDQSKDQRTHLSTEEKKKDTRVWNILRGTLVNAGCARNPGLSSAVAPGTFWEWVSLPCDRVQGCSGWSHIVRFSVTNTSIPQLKRKSKSN